MATSPPPALFSRRSPDGRLFLVGRHSRSHSDVGLLRPAPSALSDRARRAQLRLAIAQGEEELRLLALLQQRRREQLAAPVQPSDLCACRGAPLDCQCYATMGVNCCMCHIVCWGDAITHCECVCHNQL